MMERNSGGEPMKRYVLAAVAASLLTVPAAAQNLLQNPGFAVSIAGWTPFGSTTSSFGTEDAEGVSFSGSALIGSAEANASGGLKQCVPILAKVPYSIVVRVRLVSGSAGDSTSGGYPFASYAYYSDAACATHIASDADVAVGSEASASWSAFAVYASTRPTAPPNAKSVLVSIGVQNRTNGPFPSIAFDDILFAPYRPERVTIAASASIHGQNNAFFQTDLWLVNSSTVVSVPVIARHRCFAGQTCGNADKLANVPARGTLQFNDAIGGFFGDPGTAGAIELTFDSALSRVSALSRTYSPSLPAPTTGSALAGLATFEARSRSVLPGLASNGGDLAAGFRTNVGAYNPSVDSPATVTFTLYREDGARLGNPVERTLQPGEPIQINDVFAAAGAGSTVTTNAYAIVSSTFDVFAYATVIDNRTADSMILTGQPDQTSIYP
jgi:hypothetical protein